jgi:hypothetical protein
MLIKDAAGRTPLEEAVTNAQAEAVTVLQQSTEALRERKRICSCAQRRANAVRDARKTGFTENGSIRGCQCHESHFHDLFRGID